MNTTLDGKALFDEQDLQMEIDSPQRASMERSIPGLDGTLSIDLGRRPRSLRQRGTLRAAGQAQMQTRLSAIEACIDGRTHTLTTASGHVYTQVRMDALRRLKTHVAGPGISVEYEIAYTQLGAP
jgi:hypothetical protein